MVLATEGASLLEGRYIYIYIYIIYMIYDIYIYIYRQTNEQIKMVCLGVYYAINIKEPPKPYSNY